MRSWGRQRSGFTLIEMLVVISLMGMIIILLGNFVSNSWSSYRMQNITALEQDQAASALRDFEITTRATTQVSTASVSELKFLRFFDLDSPYPSQVRYFMNGNQFEVGQTEPVVAGTNVSYPAQNEQIKLVIKGIVNGGTLFKYYAGDNTELAAPVNLSSIRMIGLTLEIDANGARQPGPVGVSTKVNLRNMKDNL